MKKIYISSFFSFILPSILLLGLLFGLFTANNNYHQKESKITNSLSIVYNQYNLLDLVYIQANFLISNGKNQKLEEELYISMAKYQNQLFTLKNGGYLSLPLSKLLLSSYTDQSQQQNLGLTVDTWNKFERYLRAKIIDLPETNQEKKNALKMIENMYFDMKDFSKSLINSHLIQKEHNIRIYKTQNILLVIGCLFFSLLLTGNYFRYVRKPIKQIKVISQKVVNGDLSNNIAYEHSDNFGLISKNYNKTISYLKDIVKILNTTGNGDFKSSFELKSNNDDLGKSIIQMRSKLNDLFENDRKSSHILNWTNIGLAHFSDLLQKNSDNIQALLDNITLELIKYLNAHQGSVFTYENEDQSDIHLKLVSIFAWNKQKFIERKIMPGEGLIGQSILEKGTIYLSDIPDNYIDIFSGLGKTKPVSILIVPMIYNNAVMGVIEMASMKEFEKHEISFLEKVSENIASSLSNVKTNEKNRKLFEDTQSMMEQLRAQEEELRQNMEELEATQESINQHIQNIELEKQKNTSILESCADGVITFNQEGVVEFFNKSAEETWLIDRNDIIGKSIKEIIKLELIEVEDGITAKYIQSDGSLLDIGIRTEVMVENSEGDEESVLLTMSRSNVNGEYFFALFAQNITVEFF